MAKPHCIHMSASSIGSFKACPARFRLAYREGLRVVEDTEALRIGTNWHALHETYQNAYREGLEHEAGLSHSDIHEHAMAAVIDHLNERYASAPVNKTTEEWDLERIQLLTGFIAYHWYYQNDVIEYLSQEMQFDLPIISPVNGMPLSLDDAKVVGRIDHIIKWQGMVGVKELKSTTRDIDQSSDYWLKARKDTQVSMYAYAIRQLKDLPPAVLTQSAEGFGNTLYDVWRRPKTRPTTLSQKDTAAFLESSTYFGQSFDLVAEWDTTEEVKNAGKKNETTVTTSTLKTLTVDGVSAEVTVGKSGGSSIRETIAMYGARLMNDITEQPDRYFQRREIARTERDLEQFKGDLYNIYQAMRNYDKTGTWYENEHSCQATFKCQYMPICYGPGSAEVSDGETTPNGFKRIFVDLTINGQEQEE